jgi:hypothetical protein
MTPVREPRRTGTYPEPLRVFAVHVPEASMAEVRSAQSMEHSHRWIRGMDHDDPSLGGCEASLALSSTFQSLGPTSGGRPGEFDVGGSRVRSGCRPLFVRLEKQDCEHPSRFERLQSWSARQLQSICLVQLLLVRVLAADSFSLFPRSPSW